MSWVFEDPRRVLNRHGLRPKRSYSQNFLISPHAVASIVKACELQAAAPVVELGPGCGTLTFALTATGAKVYALERDPEMLQVLQAERQSHPDADLTLVAGDAKTFSLADFAAQDERITVVGNLPYAITGAIFRRLYEQHTRVARAVFMVQREVRDRLVAPPDSSEYGALTVFASQLFEIETVLHLPRTAFHPPPKVTSTVVRLLPRAKPRAEPSEAFEQIVRAAFQARRKTLRNALAQALGLERAQAALAAADIDPMRRGETLSVEEFGKLAENAGVPQ